LSEATAPQDTHQAGLGIGCNTSKCKLCCTKERFSETRGVIMASVDFGKMNNLSQEQNQKRADKGKKSKITKRTATNAKALMKHCDKDERLMNNHSNSDIDKDAVHKNTSLRNLSYSELCEAYDRRIAEIDSSGYNKNIRNDRVTCFSLYIPAPLGLQDDKIDAWYGRVADNIMEQYDRDDEGNSKGNFLDMKVHKDERHNYIDPDTKQLCTSRIHAHAFVIPEHDGGLNGKWFSSVANMNKLNNSIHMMSVKEFGVLFMDGTGKKSRGKVEKLKEDSLKAAYEIVSKAESLEQDIPALEAHKKALESEIEPFEYKVKNHKMYRDFINSIKPEKAIMGGVKGANVNVENIENLLKIALINIKRDEDYEKEQEKKHQILKDKEKKLSDKRKALRDEKQAFKSEKEAVEGIKVARSDFRKLKESEARYRDFIKSHKLEKVYREHITSGIAEKAERVSAIQKDMQQVRGYGE
jgi:hypothetical protein